MRAAFIIPLGALVIAGCAGGGGRGGSEAGARAADQEPARAAPERAPPPDPQQRAEPAPPAAAEPAPPAAVATHENPPAWFRPGPVRRNGRLKVCVQADGASLVEARRVAIEAAREEFRRELGGEPTNFIPDRLTPVRLPEGGYRVYVLASAAAPKE